MHLDRNWPFLWPHLLVRLFWLAVFYDIFSSIHNRYFFFFLFSFLLKDKSIFRFSAQSKFKQYFYFSAGPKIKQYFLLFYIDKYCIILLKSMHSCNASKILANYFSSCKIISSLQVSVITLHYVIYWNTLCKLKTLRRVWISVRYMYIHFS